MILSKHDIQTALDNRLLVVDPPPSKIDQISINLHIGRGFTTFAKPSEDTDHIAAYRVRPSLLRAGTLWNKSPPEQDTFRLEPGKFVMVQTLERIVLPANLMGLIEGRSSWARAGISVHLSAPKIDPGFDGTITLEMVNHGELIYELATEEDAPAQLMFIQLSKELASDDLYGVGPKDAFQFQTEPLPSKR